jgi:hypothetical protein
MEGHGLAAETARTACTRTSAQMIVEQAPRRITSDADGHHLRQRYPGPSARCSKPAGSDFRFPATSRSPTVRIDAERTGIRTAEHILRLVAGMPVAKFTTIPISLIVRGSTAPPASQAPRS